MGTTMHPSRLPFLAAEERGEELASSRQEVLGAKPAKLELAKSREPKHWANGNAPTKILAAA